jgi:hypothetical protein
LPRTPAFAFNLARDPRLFPFPENKDVNEKTLTEFIQDFIRDRLVPFEYRYCNINNCIRPPSDHSSHVKKSPIYKLLTNVTELGINNFTDIALREGTDVVVLIFYPQDDNKK